MPHPKFLSLFDPAPVPAPVDPPAPSQGIDVQTIINAARNEEKAKLYKTHEALKQQAKEANDAKAALEAKLKDIEAKALPQGEQVQKALADIQARLEASEKARLDAERRAAQEGLERYRSDAILRAKQQGIQLLDHLVMGSNPQEIEQAVMVAAAEYQNLQQTWLKQAEANGYKLVQVTPGAPGPAPAGGIPPSPYYVPPPIAAGLPSVVNGSPVTEQPMDMGVVTQMTSENAVRSGDYAKNREALMARVRQGGMAQPGQPSVYLGSNPRFTPPAQYVAPQPVNQPLPYPSAPQPTYPFPPSMPAPVPQPGNPNAVQVIPQQIEAIAAQTRAQALARGGQTGAQAAFAARFQNTPPVGPQG